MSETSVPPVPQQPRKPFHWREVVLVGIGAIAGALVATLIAAAPSLIPDARLKDAVSACGNPAGITLSSSGTSVSIDGKGDEDYSGASLDDISCVLYALEIPDSTISRIDQTRALDGRQSDSWDGIEVSWSYHPDSGVSAVLEYEG